MVLSWDESDSARNTGSVTPGEGGDLDSPSFHQALWSAFGTIAWTDLTVPDAEGLRDFYEQVVGWSSEGLSMGPGSSYAIIRDPAGAVSALYEVAD